VVLPFWLWNQPEHEMASHISKEEKGWISTLSQKSYRNCLMGCWGMYIGILVDFLPKSPMCTLWNVPIEKDCHSSTWWCTTIHCILTLQTIIKNGWEVPPHSPYSLDLVPTDYHLFWASVGHKKCQHYKNNIVQETMYTQLQDAGMDSTTTGSLSSCSTGRIVWIISFCRKVIEHVQVLLVVTVLLHVPLFHCTINMLMTFGITYMCAKQAEG
jgi:hypothetical protein